MAHSASGTSLVLGVSGEITIPGLNRGPEPGVSVSSDSVQLVGH